MSSYQLQTLNYKGLQITPNEKSFLEILHAKVIDPRAHKSEIESEEKRLIQEVNLRRHGELAHNVVSRPALPAASQPTLAKPVAPAVPPKSTNISSILTKEEFEPDESNQNTESQMDVDVDKADITQESTSRIRKKQRVDAEEEEEQEIIYYFPQEGVVGSPKPWFAGSAVNAAEYPLKQFFQWKHADQGKASRSRGIQWLGIQHYPVIGYLLHQYLFPFQSTLQERKSVHEQ